MVGTFYYSTECRIGLEGEGQGEGQGKGRAGGRGGAGERQGEGPCIEYS